MGGAADLAGQRWLLTGAAGRIGRPLRAHLRTLVGTLVVADLAAPDDTAEGEVATAFDVASDDPAQRAALDDAVRGCDGVVHLAGVSDEAPWPDLLRVNALGTHHLLEAVRRHGVPRLVCASSNRATGAHPVTALLDDASPVRPDGLYGASKAAVEALVRAYADKFGLQAALLRIGSYGQRPEGARQAATWLSPGDAERAFVAAMTTPQPFSLFYAVSANRHRWWSLEPGRRAGFVPVDDASDVLGPDVLPPADGPQGGEYAAPAFTLPHL